MNEVNSGRDPNILTAMHALNDIQNNLNAEPVDLSKPFDSKISAKIAGIMAQLQDLDLELQNRGQQ